ncbi:hypothetical protein [Streptomyces sp. NPDC057302]|uniref:hypothetical protein n=1 Tax=Streptomyces sp. NPDC057302 TaxID=3346094 RepID=UPI0036341077
MTTYDSDIALDALLAQADDAVLTAVEDGLDLAAGNRALHAAVPTAYRRGARTADWMAAIERFQRQGPDDPAGVDNALLHELLSVLGEAGRAARTLRGRMEASPDGVQLQYVSNRLSALANGARRRMANGPAALRALEEIRRSVARILSSLEDIDGEAHGLAAHFVLFDDLLVQAHALVVRLFADHGERPFLPVPAR